MDLSLTELIVVQDVEKLPSEKENVKTAEPSTECRILENLLKESLDSASLLAFKGKSLEGDSAQNLLAAVIAKKILKENNSSAITGGIYYRWAHKIKELFPGERTTSYYIPACTTANGQVLQGRGKLVHQVLNQRRRLQNLGALPKGNGKRTREYSPTCSSVPSPRPLPGIFSCGEDNEENIDDDLQWLENSSDPWCLVEDKWERTLKARTRTLYDAGKESIEGYFEKYPALKKPQGYSLIHKDFNAAHGIYKDNLFINFPLMKIKLQELLKKKKSTDPFLHDLVALTNSSNEENTNIAGFLTIPLLLNTAAVRQKKKRGSSASQSWKPSKVEVREGFIKHVKSSAEISQTIELRITALQKIGLPSQPYVIVVGESFEKIDTFLVVANRSVMYERQSIMHAIDTCYKVTWALNAEYSIDTYPVWYFIQKGIYKMSSEYDKGSTAAESLLTDCNV
ncbi:uncharacterized protein LOC134670069 [Cydia fagiglandana]|uniref:uncharacterized protein LOC134670069 n=1 Tax=Cydia fagiglandana TaxID=1458189 RepID=UPI002FEDE563